MLSNRSRPTVGPGQYQCQILYETGVTDPSNSFLLSCILSLGEETATKSRSLKGPEPSRGLYPPYQVRGTGGDFQRGTSVWVGLHSWAIKSLAQQSRLVDFRWTLHPVRIFKSIMIDRVKATVKVQHVTSDLVTNGIWHEHLLEADLVKLTNS